MEPGDEVVELLRRMEANQARALQLQQEQYALAKAQFERSEKTINESVALQREAVARQSLVGKIVLPLIVVLLALLGYLLVRWRVF